MIPALPDVLLRLPIAHRGLHDITDGRPENSRAAIRAALDAGYGIELDLQLSADAQALVFHDYDMTRLTGQRGPIRQLTAQQADKVQLLGGDNETIPTFPEVLGMVAGRVPLLIELKDQDGAMGPNIGPLEQAVTDALATYDGPVAVMSFNPHSTAKLAELAPTIPRGLVTEEFPSNEWPLPKAVCERLREIPDFEWAQAGFISHEHVDLHRPRVTELKQAGVPILCWTVKSAEVETKARAIADNITFEGYLPSIPA